MSKLLRRGLFETLCLGLNIFGKADEFVLYCNIGRRERLVTALITKCQQANALCNSFELTRYASQTRICVPHCRFDR